MALDKETFLATLGADLKAVRESAGLSQQAVADLFGWGRDAVSKIECGKTAIGVYEYLALMAFMREFAPDHPALAMLDAFYSPRRRRR